MSRPAVILDVDGTLVDSNDAHARAWVEAFAESGIQVDYERVRRSIGMGGDKLMPNVAGITEETSQGKRISERRGEIFTSRYLPQLTAFPRVRELVERFVRDGFTVVVASSAQEDELELLLERAGVADLIKSSTSSDDAERSKPDPDIVSAALKRSRAAARSAVMLGDTPYDVEAALRTGVAIVGVECGGWQREDLRGAAEVYASPAEILDHYDDSLFARLRDASALDIDPAEPRPLFDMNRVFFIAAGVAGIALLALALRAISRRRSQAGDDEQVEGHRPGLGPRERERLRHIIERTS